MRTRRAGRVAVEGLTKRRTLICFVRQALAAQPAFSVRGSSRRITSMRFRPANTRVINRRDDILDRHLLCFPFVGAKQRCKITPPAPRLVGHSILEQQLQRKLNLPRVRTGVEACYIWERSACPYAGCAGRRCASPICHGGRRTARRQKVRRVEKIEHFRSELKPQRFRYRKFLEQRKIQMPLRRSKELIHVLIPKCILTL